jgi:hypothetical protein
MGAAPAPDVICCIDDSIPDVKVTFRELPFILSKQGDAPEPPYKRSDIG